MDLETILKRIEGLELHLNTLKKTISNQNKKVGELDDRTINFLEKIREQNIELSRVSSAASNLGHIDSVISQMRHDFNSQVEESEKRQTLKLQMQEKLHTGQLKGIEEKIEKARNELSGDFGKKLKLFMDEDTRIVQQFKEIEGRVDRKLIEDDDTRGFLNLIHNTALKNEKQLEDLISNFDSYKNRLDEMRSKVEIVINDMKIFESRLNEVVAGEIERKQSFIMFMEQQAVLKNDRDRTWQEWSIQFEEFAGQMNKLLPDLQKKQLDMDKMQKSFSAMSEKLDRRINEITEMYRLMDEKFRQEWTTYKTDLDKRLKNISASLDEKYVHLSGSLESIRERTINVEDETHEMREALLLMSREIQKGMKSLMNMVNGWMEAFDQIGT